MDKSQEERDIELLMSFVRLVTADMYFNGSRRYNIVFDENQGGLSTRLEGLAFSTNGENFFGYVLDKSTKSNAIDFYSYENKVFAGTYIPNKGLSIIFLPLSDPFLNIKGGDFNLNATTRNADNQLHGRYDLGLVRVNITRNDNLNQEQIVRSFIDVLGQLTARYLDKAVELTYKALEQEDNIKLIDKIYEQFKDIPIPACFADDGASPKTKM